MFFGIKPMASAATLWLLGPTPGVDQVTRRANQSLVGAPVTTRCHPLYTQYIVVNASFIRRVSVAPGFPRRDLDAVLPMLYHSFYHEDVDWIGAQCRAGVERLPRGIPLYSGVFVPALQPDELVQAVRASLAGGARGVSLFAAGSMTEAHWSAFAGVSREA